MLTVLIPTKNNEEALARTLACLVAGAVEGMVREVIICDRGSTDGTARVADHAGCVLMMDAGLDQGVERARGEWLLLLEPGARLSADWTEAVREHVAASERPARFTVSGARTAAWLSWLSGKRNLHAGLLLRRHALVPLVAADGRRFKAPYRTVRLAAGIVPPR